jgi:transposase
MPIGYKAFPGSTYEGHTLIPILETIKKRYQLDKVIFVGDSGMLNSDNLLALEEANYEYIIGARLKNQKAAIKKQVLDLNGYKSHSEDSQGRLKDIPLDENHRLIVLHSMVRARKDVYDRERAIKN